MDEVIYGLAARVGRELRRRGLMMASAESCTGGWVGQAMTMVPGSSEWFERGFITYTYISKREMLGVRPGTLARHGAVSEQVVAEMARGAIAKSHAQIAVSISGVAGPSGGSKEKPVGTVCFGFSRLSGETLAETRRFRGDRDAIRRRAVIHALKGILKILAASAR
jgi:nicotinamide-nucleotide amidase